MTNFEQSINRDVAALEGLLNFQNNQYHDSAKLLNKPWYGVGLEDNDSNNDRDGENKKGIVRKMIDAIKAFISNIINKIKSFFTGDSAKKEKEAEESIKNNKGPSDEAMAAAMQDFAKNVKSHTPAKDEPEELARLRKEAQEYEKKMANGKQADAEFEKALAEARARVQKDLEQSRNVSEIIKKGLADIAAATGKVPTEPEVKTICVEWMINRADRSVKGEFDLFVTMLTKEFHDTYVNILQRYELLRQPVRPEGVTFQEDLAKFEEISPEFDKLEDLIKQNKQMNGLERRDIIGELMLGDPDKKRLFETYFKRNSSMLENAHPYMQSLYQVIDKLEVDNTDEAKEKITAVQGIIKQITRFVKYSLRIRTIATDVGAVISKHSNFTVTK